MIVFNPNPIKTEGTYESAKPTLVARGGFEDPFKEPAVTKQFAELLNAIDGIEEITEQLFCGIKDKSLKNKLVSDKFKKIRGHIGEQFEEKVGRWTLKKGVDKEAIAESALQKAVAAFAAVYNKLEGQPSSAWEDKSVCFFESITYPQINQLAVRDTTSGQNYSISWKTSTEVIKDKITGKDCRLDERNCDRKIIDKLKEIVTKRIKNIKKEHTRTNKKSFKRLFTKQIKSWGKLLRKLQNTETAPDEKESSGGPDRIKMDIEDL